MRNGTDPAAGAPASPFVALAGIPPSVAMPRQRRDAGRTSRPVRKGGGHAG
jgi:hypothetical protein